ncbi:M13 family metallopeptidase [Geminocystis sp. NIES-3709]|uniref:M13 family metallopeptidase n=1 Tax=Geminocystis sp. NIES-3709 TaxID=1617448 RepID=UPI0005FC8756|nr:M13 family metallopeptidase [Geminocystis sp. NIES-3709]BAQ65602.1 peptidase [Geminocystis sp. NIES-3709]
MKLSSRLFLIALTSLSFTITNKAIADTSKKETGFSINNIDTSVKPQDNFYQFANGNWLKKAVIPDDNVRVDSFTDVEAVRDQKLLKIITQASGKSAIFPKESIPQQVGDLYLSGMNLELRNKLGIVPIQPILTQIDSIATPEELITVMANHSLKGLPSIFMAGVSTDFKNSQVNALYIAPILPQQKDFYSNDNFSKQREAYITHIAKIFILGGEKPEQAQSQAQTVFAIETALAESQLTPADGNNPSLTYHKKSLTQLKNEIPNINWDLYFQEMGLSGLQEVVVRQPKYMAMVNQLMKEKSLEDWKTYLRWRLLSGTAPHLTEDFVQEDFEFEYKVMKGAKQQKPLEQRIAEVVRTMLPHPTAKLYVAEYFSADDKAKAEKMVENIKAEFRLRLQENPWMSSETRQKALEKLDKMKSYIGYPDEKEWVDYSSIDIKTDDLVGNLLRINEWNTRRNLATLNKPPVYEPFFGHANPTEVNAQYSSNINSIEIPAAILQAPFFDASLDDAVNYCAIGGVIAHEITHGFDSTGRTFDAEGNLKDWWTAEDAKKFDERANKLIEQYNQYEPLPGLFINGELSLTENIADLGGINIAHSALQRSLTDAQKAEKIDGYTPSQRCFISWAQVWKSKWRPEILRLVILGDPHPPSEFRVKGSLVNTPDFFPAFNIQKGDRMNKDEADIIKIW